MENLEELMALVKSRPEGVTNLVVDSLGFWSWGGARKTRQRKNRDGDPVGQGIEPDRSKADGFLKGGALEGKKKPPSNQLTMCQILGTAGSQYRRCYVSTGRSAKLSFPSYTNFQNWRNEVARGN